MEGFAHSNEFCPIEACPDYGKLQKDQSKPNLKRIGKTRAGVQRYQCKTCLASFIETRGTIFYRKRTPEHEIFETLALLAEGNRVSSLTRAKGYKEDTILVWLREAAATWQDTYYNLIRPHKSLRLLIESDANQRWQKRMPAVAAGLTDHIWTARKGDYLKS